MNTYEKSGEGWPVIVNYASDEDAYPERAQRVEGPLLNPTKDSCPEEHRDEGPFLAPDEGCLS